MPRPVDLLSSTCLAGRLRALAVLAVIAYHEEFAWAPGGLLGVGVFFTLSGFLITSILISQWARLGGIKLGDFWLHRARRLLPALFMMLAVVTAWVTVADRARLDSLRTAVGAAAAYFSNWYLIARNQSYFARFAPPAPLDHRRSLAVEEQFYLLWPLLLLAGLIAAQLAHGHRVADRADGAPHGGVRLRDGYPLPARSGPHPGVLEGNLILAPCSIGAMLAMAWPKGAERGTDSATRPASRWNAGAARRGRAGRLLIGLTIPRVGQYSPFAYRGGLVLLSVATAAVVAATAYPASIVGRRARLAPAALDRGPFL